MTVNDKFSNLKVYRDTYFIEGSEKNTPGKPGSLAINPQVHLDTKIFSWQDTTLQHPKTVSFDKIKENEDGSIQIFGPLNDQILSLKLLTKKIFDEVIKGEVPKKFQSTDESLRSWYSHFVEEPYDPQLYQ